MQCHQSKNRSCRILQENPEFVALQLRRTDTGTRLPFCERWTVSLFCVAAANDNDKDKSQNHEKCRRLGKSPIDPTRLTSLSGRRTIPTQRA
jgi:hypothetical protein